MTFLMVRPLVPLIVLLLVRSPPSYMQIKSLLASSVNAHFASNYPTLSPLRPDTTATSLQRPFFGADSPYIHSCFNLFTTAISLQWPFSSVPKVAVVKRFNCITNLKLREKGFRKVCKTEQEKGIELRRKCEVTLGLSKRYYGKKLQQINNSGLSSFHSLLPDN